MKNFARIFQGDTDKYRDGRDRRHAPLLGRWIVKTRARDRFNPIISRRQGRLTYTRAYYARIREIDRVSSLFWLISDRKNFYSRLASFNRAQFKWVGCGSMKKQFRVFWLFTQINNFLEFSKLRILFLSCLLAPFRRKETGRIPAV